MQKIPNLGRGILILGPKSVGFLQGIPVFSQLYVDLKQKLIPQMEALTLCRNGEIIVQCNHHDLDSSISCAHCHSYNGFYGNFRNTSPIPNTSPSPHFLNDFCCKKRSTYNR